MLGASAVGKSSLVSQFMTSEYLHAYDTSIGEFSSSLVAGLTDTGLNYLHLMRDITKMLLCRNSIGRLKSQTEQTRKQRIQRVLVR